MGNVYSTQTSKAFVKPESYAQDAGLLRYLDGSKQSLLDRADALASRLTDPNLKPELERIAKFKRSINEKLSPFFNDYAAGRNSDSKMLEEGIRNFEQWMVRAEKRIEAEHGARYLPNGKNFGEVRSEWAQKYFRENGAAIAKVAGGVACVDLPEGCTLTVSRRGADGKPVEIYNSSDPSSINSQSSISAYRTRHFYPAVPGATYSLREQDGTERKIQVESRGGVETLRVLPEPELKPIPARVPGPVPSTLPAQALPASETVPSPQTVPPPPQTPPPGQSAPPILALSSPPLTVAKLSLPAAQPVPPVDALKLDGTPPAEPQKIKPIAQPTEAAPVAAPPSAKPEPPSSAAQSTVPAVSTDELQVKNEQLATEAARTLITAGKKNGFFPVDGISIPSDWLQRQQVAMPIALTAAGKQYYVFPREIPAEDGKVRAGILLLKAEDVTASLADLADSGAREHIERSLKSIGRWTPAAWERKGTDYISDHVGLNTDGSVTLRPYERGKEWPAAGKIYSPRIDHYGALRWDSADANLVAAKGRNKSANHYEPSGAALVLATTHEKARAEALAKTAAAEQKARTEQENLRTEAAKAEIRTAAGKVAISKMFTEQTSGLFRADSLDLPQDPGQRAKTARPFATKFDIGDAATRDWFYSFPLKSKEPDGTVRDSMLMLKWKEIADGTKGFGDRARASINDAFLGLQGGKSDTWITVSPNGRFRLESGQASVESRAYPDGSVVERVMRRDPKASWFQSLSKKPPLVPTGEARIFWPNIGADNRVEWKSAPARFDERQERYVARD